MKVKQFNGEGNAQIVINGSNHKSGVTTLGNPPGDSLKLLKASY